LSGQPRRTCLHSPRFWRSLSVALLLTTAGCGQGLDAVDRDTDRLLKERTAQIRAGDTAPSRRFEIPGGLSDARLRETAPATTNPTADELRFRAADEKRNVAERLTQLQTEVAAEPLRLDLPGAFRQAQRSAREFLTAEEDYILAAISLLIERHRWEPQLFQSVSADVTDVQFDDGSPSALRVVNELGARQRLPFGGEVEAKWVWNAAEDLRRNVTGSYAEASQIVVSGNIPLLRDAGWIAREDLIQAERNLVYAAREFENARRGLLVDIARDFFALLNLQDGIDSQERALDSLKKLQSRQRAWYEAGLLPEFDVNIATNDVLNAESALANQRESYILALDRFKVRLGLPVRTPVKIVSDTLDLPAPETTLEAATDAALEFRLDLQNRRDQLLDSKRAIRNAENQLLPDMQIRGGATVPTQKDDNPGGGGGSFGPDGSSWNAGVVFSLPLDRRVERLSLRRSSIQHARSQREYDRFRDQVILDVRSRTREIERASLNLRLAEERVKINERRKEEQELKPDEIDTQRQVDTANELLRAERARDQAKTDLRNAVLNYLLETAQLRVERDGTFQPLPGMPASAEAPPPGPEGDAPGANPTSGSETNP
jgi:outer membrane protein TolC